MRNCEEENEHDYYLKLWMGEIPYFGIFQIYYQLAFIFFSDCDRNMSTKFQKKSKEKHEQKWTFSYTAYYFHGDKSKYSMFFY